MKYNCSATLTTNSLSGNSAVGDGGGIYIDESDPVLLGNFISGNTAGHSGGGIAMESSNPVLTANTLSGNTAVFGGGVFLYGSDPVLKGNTLKWNMANSEGGGMWLGNSDPAITSNTLIGNQADYGGGMYLFGSDPILTSNNMSGNAADYGGGLYLIYSSPHCISNTLISNLAGYAGGAVSFNTSGGVITNSILIENQSYSGGAIYLSDSDPYIINSTFSANMAEFGGGIQLNHSQLHLSNCLVWGNVASQGDSGIHTDMFSTQNIIWSNIQGGFAGTGNINTDPLFVDVAGGDYRLQVQSPCINAGKPDTIGLGLPLTDLDGNPRVMGCTIDMGAYENMSQVGGTIANDTTWASDTVYVSCDVLVADGATLNINPGVVVDFLGNYSLTVSGRLLALGAVNDSIVFTSTGGNWASIIFDFSGATNDSSIMEYCIVENGRSDFGGGLRINSNAVRISHCLIRDCIANEQGGGMFLDHADPVLSNNIVSGNTTKRGGGMYLYYSSPFIVNTILWENTVTFDGGGLCLYGSDPNIINTTISSNSAYWGEDCMYLFLIPKSRIAYYMGILLL
jgi:parallel beta-helix repeat protein